MKKYPLLILLILLMPFAYSAIEQYSFEVTLAYGKAVVYGTIIQDQTVQINIALPENKALSVYADGEIYKIESNSFSVSAKEIKYNYITNELIDNSNFIFDFVAQEDIKNLSLKLILPEGAKLETPINSASSSVYPKASQITTDGQSIILVWERANFKESEELPVYVRYAEQNNSFWIYSSIIILIIAAAAIIFLVLKRKTKIVTRVKKEDMFETHLKEDEEQIINVLKMRENQCEQGTLRVVTGFPKATLSRLLKELEDRKIIYKEKRGKKNLVFLRK